MAVRLGNQVDSSTVLVLRISPMPILKARCRCGVREVIYVLFFFSCLFSGSCLMRRAFFFIFILYCFLAFCFLSKLVFSCPSTLLFFFLFFFVFFLSGRCRGKPVTSRGGSWRWFIGESVFLKRTYTGCVLLRESGVPGASFLIFAFAFFFRLLFVSPFMYVW